MITKVSKNIQRAKSKSHVGLLKLFTVLRVYLLHKRMPNSNKCIQLCTKSIIKTKKLAFSFFLLILARSNYDHNARECNFGILKKKQKQNKKKKKKKQTNKKNRTKNGEKYLCATELEPTSFDC